MECEICGKTVPSTNLYRVNEKGVDGIWRCYQHLNLIKRVAHRDDIVLAKIISGHE